MGSVGMLIAPTSRMMMAQTLVKTGRLIKKSANIGSRGDREQGRLGVPSDDGGEQSYRRGDICGYFLAVTF